MDLDLLRYAAAERKIIAAIKLAAALDKSSRAERKARWKTVMILTVFGLACAGMGVLATWMLRGL